MEVSVSVFSGSVAVFVLFEPRLLPSLDRHYEIMNSIVFLYFVGQHGIASTWAFCSSYSYVSVV